MLIGGDKTGNDRFYKQYVPLADKLYDEHLEELRQEGLIRLNIVAEFPQGAVTITNFSDLDEAEARPTDS